MNKSFTTALARLLDPLVLRHLKMEEIDTSEMRAPRPEPEVMAIAKYHRGISDRNFMAAAAQREELLALEETVLLTFAECYAVRRRARAMQPLIGGKP